MSAEPRFPSEDGPRRERHLRALPSALRPPAASSGRRESKRRRPLVRAAVKNNAPRTILIAYALIPFALLFILLLNIFVSIRQYDLVDLRAQEKSLTQQNEAIAQEVEFYQAPQDLATRANQLGLVSSTVTASLNLQTGEIEGVPMPATKSENKADPNNVVIAPPALYDTDAFATASQRAEEQAQKEAAAKAAAEKKKAEEEKKKAEEEKQASASPSAEASAAPSEG